MGRNKPSQIIGESIVVENCELNTILNKLGARVIKTEWVAGECVVYAHSKLIRISTRLFEEDVNLQIAYTENRAVIGWPLIYGDF